MTNILEATRAEEKKRDQFAAPAKAKLNAPTYLSFAKNMKRVELLAKDLERYNKNYDALLSLVTKKEIANAEKEEREKMIKSSESAEANKLITEKIKNDAMIAKFAEPSVVIPRLNSLSMDIKDLEGRFGKLGKNYGVRVKSAFSPKALSIPKLISEICAELLSNVQMYNEDAMKLILQDGKNTAVNNAATDKLLNGSNWRSLFANAPVQETKEVNVAMENNRSDEEQKVVEPSYGLTEQDLQTRILIAELGKEKNEIDELLRNQGTGSQFSTALIERKKIISDMLSELTGIDTSKKIDEIIENKTIANTEFQSQIDQIIGYVEPVSKERHDEVEASMNEYYQSQMVQDKIDELNHKNILYLFNDAEVYKEVTKAERIDNERIAEQNQNLDVIGVDEEENETLEIELSIGALDQAVMLDNEAKEKARKIRENADIQANEIVIKQHANEQAKMIARNEIEQRKIAKEKENLEIIDMANKTAQTIFYADEGRKNAIHIYYAEAGKAEANSIYYKIAGEQQAGIIAKDELEQIRQEKIRKAADVQANELVMKDFGKAQAEELIQDEINQRKNERIRKDANVQANEIMMKDFGREQAKVLIQDEINQRKNERIRKDAYVQANEILMKDFGREQAKVLIQEEINQRKNERIRKDAYAQANEIMMKDFGREQAKVLIQDEINQRKQNKIKEAANTQANELYERNKIIKGAEEQAKLINDFVNEMYERDDIATEIVYQELAQQFNDSAENKQEQAKESSNVIETIFQNIGAVRTDDTSRYGTQFSNPRPLKIKGATYNKITDHIGVGKIIDFKEQYQSLKEQINTEFPFLNLDDKVSGRSLTA